MPALPPKADMVSTIMMSALCQQQTFRPLVDIIDLGRRSSSRGITMKFPRRQFLHLAAGAGALLVPLRVVRAESRSVRFIVGFPAGNASDVLARLMGQGLSDRLAQKLVVENRPGAGSNVGTEVVVRAPPDGYTLLLITPSNAINKTLYEKLNFDFINDIAPIASICHNPSNHAHAPLYGHGMVSKGWRYSERSLFHARPHWLHRSEW
jgi:Tripartite tricarboxylate transporter family receptor